ILSHADQDRKQDCVLSSEAARNESRSRAKNEITETTFISGLPFAAPSRRSPGMSSQPRLHAKVANRPLAVAVALACLLTATQAQDLESSQQMLIRGEYENVIEAAKAALKIKPDDAS